MADQLNNTPANSQTRQSLRNVACVQRPH